MEDKHIPLEHLWEEKVTTSEGFVNCCHQANALIQTKGTRIAGSGRIVANPNAYNAH
jgi:hypothetical protein